jgi:hypothetical protein
MDSVCHGQLQIMQFAVWIPWNMAGIVHMLFEKLGDA